MRSFYLFRSNIRELEYYHEYKDLETFENKCHDYYLQFPLWLLKKDYFDEVIIWRLTDKLRGDIIFKVDNKKFIQRWVKNFKETLNYNSPEISFFRGGFPEYDEVTKMNPNFFGKKLYLGAGKRIFPKWQGRYDNFLIEDERDFVKNANCLPFYKTAISTIFHPVNTISKKWDICWPSNFSQLRYKGQNFFISLISNNTVLQKLKIIHCGNQPEIGKNICDKLGVTNIKFAGHVERDELNILLNNSKFGLNLSGLDDGCPRVSTEILMSGAPLILNEDTRLLKEFRQKGVINVNKENIIKKILWAFNNYNILKNEVDNVIKNELSFDNINQKNIDLWKKI